MHQAVPRYGKRVVQNRAGKWNSCSSGDPAPGSLYQVSSCREAPAGDPVRCGRPSEAPERLRADKYQGRGTQAGAAAHNT